MTKLIWLIDLHLVEPGRDWPHGIDPLERLRTCLEEIRELHADVARIVISGDLVQHPHPEAYRLLRAELERMPMDYRLLVGNHTTARPFWRSFLRPKAPTASSRALMSLPMPACCISIRWHPAASTMANCAQPGSAG